jgi:hypothetical protein
LQRLQQRLARQLIGNMLITNSAKYYGTSWVERTWQGLRLTPEVLQVARLLPLFETPLHRLAQKYDAHEYINRVHTQAVRVSGKTRLSENLFDSQHHLFSYYESMAANSNRSTQRAFARALYENMQSTQWTQSDWQYFSEIMKNMKSLKKSRVATWTQRIQLDNKRVLPVQQYLYIPQLWTESRGTFGAVIAVLKRHGFKLNDALKKRILPDRRRRSTDRAA